MADLEVDELADADPRAATRSEVLETAARGLGVHTHRLTSEIVLCEHSGRTVAFKGLVGGGVGTVARVLRSDARQLRRYLAARGVPTVPPNSPTPEGVVHLAVVGDRVVASTGATQDGDVDPSAAKVAVSAIGAMPGAAYGAVTVTSARKSDGERGESAVVSVDPLFSGWETYGHPACRVVAEAILASELAIG